MVSGILRFIIADGELVQGTLPEGETVASLVQAGIQYWACTRTSSELDALERDQKCATVVFHFPDYSDGQVSFSLIPVAAARALQSK